MLISFVFGFTMEYAQKSRSLAVSFDERPSGSFAALAFAYSDGETFLLKHALWGPNWPN